MANFWDCLKKLARTVWFWLLLMLALVVIAIVTYGIRSNIITERQIYSQGVSAQTQTPDVNLTVPPCEQPPPAPARIESVKAPTPLVATAPTEPPTPKPVRKTSKLDNILPCNHGVYFFPYLGEEFNEVLREFKTKHPDLQVTFSRMEVFAGRPLGHMVQVVKNVQP